MAKKDDKEELVYVPSTHEVDLTERLANDNKVSGPIKTINPGVGDVEAGNLYLGTYADYQNHANDTEAPSQGDDDESGMVMAEKKALDAYSPRTDLKEQAAKVENDEDVLDPQDGVSPRESLPEPLESGSPLVVADPGSGNVVESADEDVNPEPVKPSANFTGGTGQNAPTQTKPTSPQAKDK